MPTDEEFMWAGLDCKVLQHESGHWCGYVRRPEDVEPVRWQPDYDSKHGELLETDVEVWGGITYGPDSAGWVGFDDDHALSLLMKRDADSEKEAVKEETKRLARQIQGLRGHDLDARAYQVLRETDRIALFEGQPPALRDAICWAINPDARYPRDEVSVDGG